MEGKRRTAKRDSAPAVAPRQSYHHGELAESLSRVALELIEKDGVEAFSLRDAAARCGVAVSAAYKHYDSKAAILHAVADLGFQTLADRMKDEGERSTRALTGTRAAEARLVATGRAYILFASEHPNLFRLMYGPHGPKGGGTDARPDAPARRLTRLLVGSLKDVLTAYGKEDADVEVHMVIAWALVHGFSMMVVDGVWTKPGKRALDDMIAELGQAVLRSLR
ncbi:Transcriptional regulator, TetR family protein [Minicystis rosea]|nr:Transcriptional regulator, TetR family protein [Minicystis rosea]